MKKFLLLSVFAAALITSANAFKVSTPDADGDKTAPTKKEAGATDNAKKEPADKTANVDTLGSAVTEMKANADAAVAAQAQSAAAPTAAAGGMTAKTAEVKDTTKTPTIMNEMAKNLPQNPENSNKPKAVKK